MILAGCLALGIALSAQCLWPLWLCGAAFVVCLLIFLLLVFRAGAARGVASWYCLCALFLSGGAFLFCGADATPQIFRDGDRRALVALTGRVAEVTDKGYVLDHLRWGAVADGGGMRLRGKVRVLQSRPAGGVRAGDVVAVRGRLLDLGAPRNPGGWDGETFARSRGMRARIFAGRHGQTRVLRRDALGAVERLIRRVGERFDTALEIPRDAAGPCQETLLLKGMILGQRAQIDAGIQESFLRTNTYHILAISGQQMTLIFLIFFGVLRALGVSSRAASLVCIPAILLYGAVVGWQASVLRAVIMIVLLLVGLAFDREVRLLRLAGLAAMGMLLVNPYELFDVGFQLSFLAVLFLIVFTPRLLRRFDMRWPGWKAEDATWGRRFLRRAVMPLLAASLVAWLATAPVIAWQFGWFSPVTLLANLCIVGWVSCITIPLGFVSLILGSAWVALAYPINVINGVMTHGLIAMTGFLARIPYGSFAVAAPGECAIFLYYAFFVVAAWWSGRKILMACLAMTAVAAQVLFMYRLECVFFDVGQGDAIGVRFPNGKIMLVDAGPGGYGARFDRDLAAYLHKIGAAGVDYLVMSHPHADHIGGVPALLQAMPVGGLLGNGRVLASVLYRRLLLKAEEKRVPLDIARAQSDWLREGSAHVDVLLPALGDGRRDNNENERSIVLALRYGGRTLLLTGDIERKAEANLITGCVRGGAEGASRRMLAADVLKVPHHGGDTSCTPGFLDRLKGKWAVISVGRRNKFRHPREPVLRRLRERGWNIFRTDRDGAVVVRGYGPWWTLQTVLSRRLAMLLWEC